MANSRGNLWILILPFYLIVTINGRIFTEVFFTTIPNRITSKTVIFDTDMGGDDAWALQMLLKAEKELKSVKVLAITTVDGNTDVENALKNAYRILDGLDRTDVSCFSSAFLVSNEIKYIFDITRFRFTKELSNR